MTIDRISLDDKIVYCKKRLDDYKIKYTYKDLKEFANVPFWTLKNMLIKLIIECKSNDITSLNKQIILKKKMLEKLVFKIRNRRREQRNIGLKY